MGRAAAGLGATCARLLGGVYGARVVVLAGSGDNGGDALYAAERLTRRGARTHAVLAGSRVHPGGAAALRRAGGRLVAADDRAAATAHRRRGSDHRRDARHRRPRRTARPAVVSRGAGRASWRLGGRRRPAERDRRRHRRRRGRRGPGRRHRHLRHLQAWPADRSWRIACGSDRTCRHRAGWRTGGGGRRRASVRGSCRHVARPFRRIGQVPPRRARRARRERPLHRGRCALGWRRGAWRCGHGAVPGVSRRVSPTWSASGGRRP